MTSSLVGSEMCIRDRRTTVPSAKLCRKIYSAKHRAWEGVPDVRDLCKPVSYTHLTLPTICSV
eukprot:8683469-Prorocentrum_lima.AAC.1